VFERPAPRGFRARAVGHGPGPAPPPGRCRRGADSLAARVTAAQRKALQLAIERYAGDDGRFNLELWTEPFNSGDPATINAVVEVTGGYQGLVNHLAEMLRTGAKLAGLDAAYRNRDPSGPELIAAARNAGCFSANQADVLTELYRTRNRLQHASPDIQADEVQDQVVLLLKTMPRLLDSYVKWMAGHGVELLPRSPRG